MDRKNIDKLITEALAIEAEEAQRAGAVGFMARALTQATMPHKATPGNEYTRRNGLFTLSMVSRSHIGLPYGSYPRLLLSWLTTEAVRTKFQVLELGPTLSGFMHELGLIPAGGRWGTIHRLRDQMKRLFSCTVSCDYADQAHDAEEGYRIAKAYRLWWDPKSPEQIPLWKSTVTLSMDFFQEIVDRPIPVDMRALKALKRSPMAMDIYCWLTYRLSYLCKPTEILWPALQMQFGADYARERDFKAAFLHHLRSILTVYPGAKVDDGERGLLLKPSKSHVTPLPPLLRNEPQQLLMLDQVVRLRTATYEKAKRAAPGWDVYCLEREWLEWITGKEKPKNPDAAFIAFCRKKYQREGRP
jgi:hypothetical protein